jgi:hypothetical protein
VRATAVVRSGVLAIFSFPHALPVVRMNYMYHYSDRRQTFPGDQPW